MPRYKYLGKQTINLAQVGKVAPGDIITLTTELGDSLERNDGENWAMVKNPVTPPPADPKGSAVKQPTQPATPAAPIPEGVRTNSGEAVQPDAPATPVPAVVAEDQPAAESAKADPKKPQPAVKPKAS